MIKQTTWLLKMRKAETKGDQEERKKYRRKIWDSGYWITADLNLIRWDKLERQHAENIYNMLQRKAEKYVSETTAFYHSCPLPMGDGALDAFYGELDFWENAVSPHQFVRGHAFYRWLMKRLEMEK